MFLKRIQTNNSNLNKVWSWKKNKPKLKAQK